VGRRYQESYGGIGEGMNYWRVIEEYIKSKNDWVDVEQIVRDTRVPKWVVD
jgi:hypothetical protein